MKDDTIKRSDAIRQMSLMFEDISEDLSEEIIQRFGYDTAEELATEAMSIIPSADRPSGAWTPCTKNGLPLTELGRREGQKWYGYKCSECNFIYKGNALIESPFCQNCGCRMKGADDESD